MIAASGEFTLNGAAYSGKYYETFDGQYFAGANPVIGSNKRLDKVISSPQTPGLSTAPSVLNTTGNDFLLNGKPYVGPYFQDSNGDYYTAPNNSSTNPAYYPKERLEPSENQALKQDAIVGSDGKSYVKTPDGKLIPYDQAKKESDDYEDSYKRPQKLQPIASGYAPNAISLGLKRSSPGENLKFRLSSRFGINPNFFGQPTSYFPNVQDADYRRGYITRYFAKRINENGYIVEISPQEYSDINEGIVTYDVSFYQTEKIFWKLTGPLNTVRLSQYDIRAGIIDTNKRLVENLEKTFVGIKDFIGGEYSKFAIASTQ